MTSKIVEYLKNRQNQQTKFLLFNRVDVFLKSNPEFNVKEVLDKIEKEIPPSFFNKIHKIVIGNFKDDMGNSSFYKDNCIFVSPADQLGLFSDIIHELCHGLLENHSSYFYSDDIETEFLGKRKRLFDILESNGYTPFESIFSRTEYSPNLDDYLTNQIGYDKINPMIVGLFPNVYSITSLDEYIAVNFEFFFGKDKKKYVKDLCPAVYRKISNLTGTNARTHFVFRA